MDYKNNVIEGDSFLRDGNRYSESVNRVSKLYNSAPIKLSWSLLHPLQLTRLSERLAKITIPWERPHRTPILKLLSGYLLAGFIAAYLLLAGIISEINDGYKATAIIVVTVIFLLVSYFLAIVRGRQKINYTIRHEIHWQIHEERKQKRRSQAPDS